MNLEWAAAGALAGFPVGIALRDPVFRLSVPSGAPDQSTCPCCTAPVSSWLAVRCGHCGRSLVTAGMLELPTSIVLALVLGRFSAQPETLAFAFIGVLGVALAMIDITVQRLPDRLTLPAFPVLIALLAGAAAIGNDTSAFVRALLGGLVLMGSYLLLALLRPGQLGGGDIKLAGLAGLGYPPYRRCPGLSAFRGGQPGAAGSATDHSAQRDLLRAVPAQRSPHRDLYRGSRPVKSGPLRL